MSVLFPACFFALCGRRAQGMRQINSADDNDAGILVWCENNICHDDTSFHTELLGYIVGLSAYMDVELHSVLDIFAQVGLGTFF